MLGRRVLLLALTLSACEGSRSKDAKVDTHETMRRDRDLERKPADGGGRAFFDEASPRAVRAGETSRFRIVYEAGPLGIEEGGALFLQPSPFWGWDSPQTENREAPGFTAVAAEAEGVELESSSFEGLLAIHVRGRKLEPGERVVIDYETRVDRFAEREERIWIAVDGDGDGVRALVDGSPALDVLAGEPARLVLTLPSTARPGEKIRLAIAVLDGQGNRGVDESRVDLQASSGLALPATVLLGADDRGSRSVEGVAGTPGVFRVRAETASGLAAESNPLVVRDSIPRLLWADLHGHSQLSDGTGTPEDYFSYARDVAALDAAALTDHDHWGLRFLDENPALWRAIVDAAGRFDEPGRFVALAGYEWTSWLQGHRHVLFFDDGADGAEILSSFDPRYETPALLWDALEGRPALTLAHHSAGGPVSTNWEYAPPSGIEPVTEVVSVHGSSEAADTPGKIYSAVEGNFVRDALERGYRLGFAGSGDGHDGHPGLTHLASPGGGLAAIFSEERTRPAIFDALLSRRAYATNGPRIWLRMWLDDREMGSIVAEKEAPSELRLAAAAVRPVDRVEILRSGKILSAIEGGGRREISETVTLERMRAGEYVYVRVVQVDGGAAWTSPIYVDR
jgi:hypothetical protein